MKQILASDLIDNEYAYAVKEDSGAFEALMREFPIRPGHIIRCSDEEFESFKKDIIRVPVVQPCT